jgi:hypothetical protein
MQSTEAAYGLCSVMSSGSSHSRLYKKKMTAPMKIREINFMYSWSPPQCTVINKYLCGSVPLSTSEV